METSTDTSSADLESCKLVTFLQYHTKVCTILCGLCGAIFSLSLDLSPAKLIRYLTLRPLSRQRRWIFVYYFFELFIREIKRRVYGKGKREILACEQALLFARAKFTIYTKWRACSQATLPNKPLLFRGRK